MGSEEVNAFLTHLAVELHVSASTQNQALSALLFSYRELLERDLDLEGGVVRARAKRRLPVVLSEAEVRAVRRELEGEPALVVGLLYGSGLRLMEALRLRVQDLDFEGRVPTVRDGRGGKDRVRCSGSQGEALQGISRMFAASISGSGGGWERYAAHAVARKYRHADRHGAGNAVLLQRNRWKDAATGKEGRHHIDPSLVQKAVKQAVERAGLTKPASCHTFRHSFATHLLGVCRA